MTPTVYFLAVFPRVSEVHRLRRIVEFLLFPAFTGELRQGMGRWLWLPVFLLGSQGIAWADAAEDKEALAWLKKISAAARQLNYVGTFVYDQGDRMETSRVIHQADGDREQEKLETLDGPPREIIRSNGEVMSFFPESRIVKMERRRWWRNFPGLLPPDLTGIAESYQVRKTKRSRAAGYECQGLLLEPKDDMRYGHQLCAELRSGLLIKARVLNGRGESVEQIAFTQLSIGGSIDKEMLKSKYNPTAPDWRFDQPLPTPGGEAENRWTVRNIPAGFKKMVDMRRSMPGKPEPVEHLVFSDGLAAVSVFIERFPAGDKPMLGLSQRGSMHIYKKQYGDRLITVVGETPPAMVMRMADSVGFKGR